MFWLAGASLGMSLLGASANKKAAESAMRSQAAADDASRMATANSQIAAVNSQNAKVLELQRADQIMQIQGKADSVMRAESYNDLMATSMVMGAVSGRVIGEGSIAAIFEKSESDFMWDQMWGRTSLEISQAALYQDMSNIYEAGSISLGLGAEQSGVAALTSKTAQDNANARIQQSFNNTMVSGGQSLIKNYGTSLFNLGA